MENLTIKIISDAYVVSDEDTQAMAMRGDKSALDALTSGTKIVQSSGRGDVAKIVFERVIRSGDRHVKERHVLSGRADSLPDQAAFESNIEFIEAIINTGMFRHERETVALSY